MFFSLLLLSCYYCSFDPWVDGAVSGDCNQLFCVLFYVVFDSLFRCVDSFFLFLFLIHIALSTSCLGGKAFCIVMGCLDHRSIFWSYSLVHFKNDPNILWVGFIHLIRFLLYSFVSICFLALLRYSFVRRSGYWKGNLWVALNYGRQLYFFFLFIITISHFFFFTKINAAYLVTKWVRRYLVIQSFLVLIWCTKTYEIRMNEI